MNNESMNNGTTGNGTMDNGQEWAAGWAERVDRPADNRLDMVVKPENLVTAVESLRDAQSGYLAAITGVDNGPEAGDMEVLYHFCEGASVTTLRVGLPRDTPIIPSICSVLPAASVHERELMEMFGVDVVGTPNRDHLFLPDDWPENVYPLRKDFAADQAARKVDTKAAGEAEDKGERFIVPIGPQHPALKEPAHFEFAVDGELVKDAAVRLGYVHRGIEKAAEERTWTQNTYLLERICGICSHVHTAAFCNGVEQLAGVEVPPRAQVIRELIAGIERFHSHLLWFGVAAHEAGFDTLFMYTWRDRETIMDLVDELTGNRVNYSMNVLGGVKYDVTPAQVAKVREGLDFLDGRVRHYLEIISKDIVFTRRTRGIGTMTHEEAARLGALGPTARASNVGRDVRVESPYSAYRDFPVNITLETAGDLEARFVVRMQELLETSRHIRQLLDNLPEGELTTRMPRRIQPGEVISRVEAPRGELFYYIKSNGTDKPERIKIRTPTLCNMATVTSLAVGHQLADMPMLLVGVDPCFSCNDRGVLLKPVGKGNERVWTWEQLRDYGIEHYR